MDLNSVLTKYGIKRPRCGADCGDGWVPLVEKLIQDCIALGWDRQVEQIKEKFGGLRFYIGGASSAVHDLVAKAESASYSICEYCGDPGKPRNSSYWIKTLCDNCEAKRYADHSAVRRPSAEED